MASLVPDPKPASPLTVLPLSEVGRCNRAAQLDGTLYGTAAGFLSGMFGFRFLKMNKNVALLSGIATGVISGYVVSNQALQTRLAKAEADLRTLQRSKDEQPGGKWDMNRGESGQGGLEMLDDKYATTSGEH